MATFQELGLNPKIIMAVEELGFENPTEIQEKVIPQLIESDTDILALAQTGTGKTAAFALPIIHKLDVKSKKTQCIILSPTRELALQISRDIINFTKFIPGINVAAVYGGESISIQIKKLQKGAQIVVGTPGRVKDLINRRKLILTNIEYLVLDEADEMLSMGFKEELDEILSTVPEERQTLLFSATMPKDVNNIAKTYLHNTVEVTAGKKNTGAKNVKHIYYTVNGRFRYDAVKRIVDSIPDIYAIVFCRTRAETKEVADKLVGENYQADALHGDLSQAQRDHVMAKFRNRNLQLLIATDVAARGIDVNDLTHVINYRLPDQLEAYIHRSGRTGRAGKEGISVTILHPSEKRRIRLLENKVGKKFEQGLIPTGEEVINAKSESIIKKLMRADVEEEGIDKLVSRIYEELNHLNKDEIIKRFVGLEFNRYISQYRFAKDLNLKDDRKRRSEKGKFNEIQVPDNERFTRYYINIGSKDGLKPPRLLGVINEHKSIRQAEIGRIEILKKFSFIDIEKGYEDKVLDSLNGVIFENQTIKIEVSNSTISPAPKREKRKRAPWNKEKKHAKFKGGRHRRRSKDRR